MYIYISTHTHIHTHTHTHTHIYIYTIYIYIHTHTHIYIYIYIYIYININIYIHIYIYIYIYVYTEAWIEAYNTLHHNAQQRSPFLNRCPGSRPERCPRSWLQDTFKRKLVDFAWNRRFFYLPGACSHFFG